jgi:bifunctional glutamyl/prolyl-tRNA synthetase
VIVPCGITNNLKAEDREALYKACTDTHNRLIKLGVRSKNDLRENYSPGWKFNHWELKGVPIRIEIGPKDMKNSQYVLVRRDTGEKIVMKIAGVEDDIPALLDTIQSHLLAKARTDMTDHIRVVHDFDDFLNGLEEKCLLQVI